MVNKWLSFSKGDSLSNDEPKSWSDGVAGTACGKGRKHLANATLPLLARSPSKRSVNFLRQLLPLRPGIRDAGAKPDRGTATGTGWRVIATLVVARSIASNIPNLPELLKRLATLSRALLLYCRTFALRRSLCCSNRRRFDSSSQSILWASNVFSPAALNRTMRPFCRWTKRRASATCSSTRRRSSSKLIAAARSR